MRSGIPSLFLLDNIEIKDSFDQAADFVCEERAVSAPAMPLDNFAASSPIKTRGRTAHAPPADLEQTVSVPDALHPGTHDIQTSFNDSLDVSIEHDCEGCDGEWRGLEGCPLHGPLQIVLDTEVPLGEPDRALRTLPPQLAVLRSKIPGAGLGVCSAEDVPAMVRFGPYEGEVTARDRQSGYAWNILVPDGPDHFLDGEDVTKSNWMRYVNCARNIAEQNLHAYQHAGRVYYRTVRPVPAHTELLVWYGDSYAQDLGIDSARRHPPGWILGADSHCDGSADATFRTGGFHEGSGDASPGTDGHCGRVAEANPGSDGEISRPLKRRRSPCVSLPPSPPGLALKQAKSTSSQLLCSAKAAALPKQLRSGRVSVPTQRLQVGHNKTPRCGTCSAAFRSAEALRAHERCHPTLCRVSGPHLEDGAAFQRHLRVHPDAAEFKCEDCGTPFNSQERLRNHRCRHPRLKQYHGSLSETFDAQTEHELSQDGALGGDASRPTGTPCSTPCGAQLEHGDAPQRHRGEQPGVAESKCDDGVDADESLSEGADLGEDHRASECGEGPADEPTDEDDDQEPHRCLRCTAHFVHIEDLRTHLSSHRRVLAEKKQKRDRRKGKKEKKNKWKRKKEEDGKERKRTEDREEWWKRMEDEIESAEKKMEREEKDRERKAKGHWRPVACNRCDESTETFATREAFLKHILQAHYWFTEEIRKKERKRRDEEKNKKDREKNRKEVKILKEKATKKGRERKKKKKKVKKKKKGERGCWRPMACNRCGEDTETFATRKAFLKHILQAHTGQ